MFNAYSSSINISPLLFLLITSAFDQKGWEFLCWSYALAFHPLLENNCFVFQLVECPSIYELMASTDFKWEHVPCLEIWRQRCQSDGNSRVILKSYTSEEVVPILIEALSVNKVNCVVTMLFLTHCKRTTELTIIR